MPRARRYHERDAAGSRRLRDALVDLGSRQLLFRGATVLTMDPALGDLTEGDVLVQDGRILAVGPDLDTTARSDALRIDVGGMIALPGLVDGHRHCWQNSLRRLVPDADLAEYMAATHGGVAPHFTPEDMFAGTLVSTVGALDSGVTTLLDFSHNTRTPAHSDGVFDAYAESGIRAVHASAPPNAGLWDGYWPDDLERLAARCSADDRISLRMGIDVNRTHPIDELVGRARRLGLGMTMDGVMGAAASAELVAMARAGLLGPDITVVHATALDDAAWRCLRDSGARLTLATTSDQQIGLGDGIPPIVKALEFGLRPALSVDVEISLAGDLFSQMRATLATQRMFATNARFHGAASAPPLLGVHDVLEFATQRGADAVGLGDRVGSLTPGKDADLLLVRAEEINNLPLNHAPGTIVLATENANVDTVLVRGRVRKWDGALIGVDADRLRTIAATTRDRLTAAAGLVLDLVHAPHRRPLDDPTIRQWLDAGTHAGP